MRLSVIVPAFNEERTILQILERLNRERRADWEIIAVDDRSTDRTREILVECQARFDVHLVFRDTNGGKTAAVRSGLAVASGDWVIVQDADLEYDPADIGRLLAATIDASSVVYGRRPSYWNKPSRWLFAAGVFAIDTTFFCLYHKFIRDHATCYKLLPRHIVDSLAIQSTGFEGCVEITAKLMRLGLPIIQIPISYMPRTAHEGKKLTARYGLRALWTVLKWRHWNPQHQATCNCVSTTNRRIREAPPVEVRL